jgi:hypothetical protein
MESIELLDRLVGRAEWVQSISGKTSLVQVIVPIAICDWIPVARSSIVTRRVDGSVFTNAKEILMEFVATDSSYLLAPRRRSPGTAHSTSMRRVAGDAESSLLRVPDAPDTAYWTAYDYYMAERDARARRRAHVYSLVAGFAQRLRLRVFAS